MYTYLLNGFDFSKLVYGTPTLTKKVGKGSQSLTNNISVNVINESNVFSAENENSLIYEYRENYNDIEIEIKNNDVLIWKGIIDNIDRDFNQKTATLQCVEATIEALSVDQFSYYSGDGYVGDMAFAGAGVTPADHQLAVFYRYLDEDNVDIGSFKVFKQFCTTNLIYVDCDIRSEADNKLSPLKFVQNLMLDMGYIGIYKNKIFVKLYEDFLGDYGVVLKDECIIDIQSISKSKAVTTDPYSAFSITYDATGIPTTVEGSLGDSGTTTNLTSSYLEDTTKDWTINQWRNHYVYIDVYASKQILKITGNNATKLFFSGCTKSSPMTYVICQTNKIYTQDWSDYPIKLTSGANAVGTLVVTKNSENKLEVIIQIFDTMDLDVGDIVTFTIEEEGITLQPFEITQVKKELFGDISTLTCIDRIMYPLLEEFEMTVPVKVTGLTGYRLEDGTAVLTWTPIAGVSYYKIYYGIDAPSYASASPNYAGVLISAHLERWLGYNFWVAAVNFYGVEGERSEPLFLDKLLQQSGYIDGTSGYLVEKYKDWGRLEEYYYALTYKNIANADIGYLLKGSLVILDKSQRTSVQEITQIFSDSAAIQKWGETFRRLGYIDGAGTSDYLPEFVSDTIDGMKLKNPLSKKVTFNFPSLGVTVVEAGADIPNSADWFIKDSLLDEYCTYWFQTGYMLDLGNPDCLEWYKVFKVNQAMGLFAYGAGALTVNDDTKVATLIDSTKSFVAGQWVDYYIGIVKEAATLDIDWYKITANTVTALTFNYGDDAVDYQKYVINNEPYIGFHGLFMDDIWTSIYREGRIMSNHDSNTTSNSASAIQLVDNSKSWIVDEWAGYYVSVNSGAMVQITSNDAHTLNFVGNIQTGSGLPYIINEQYYYDHGIYYWQTVAAFLEAIVAHVENNSFGLYDNWIKAEKGLCMINTWPENWDAYPYYVAAINKRFRHFIMFEALQSTWNMANEVTKQYIVLDWYEAKLRWDLMKISAGVGYARLAILGYPCHGQMMLSHIAGSLMLTRYSDKIEDITAVGNIVLDQLFYDMIMAGNKDNLKTIGIPRTGYEDYYVQDTYDRYGIMSRKFEGCYVFYNPSRQVRSLSYTFDEAVINFFTGESFVANTSYTLILAPRSALFFYANSDVGEDAYNFLNAYKPFTYVDCNMSWIVFTPTGVTKIGVNSVWIQSGYTGLKKLTLDGNPIIPVGNLWDLFHSGNGIDTAAIGYTALTEAIIGVGVDVAVLLTSLTIHSVVKLESGGGTEWVVEDSGTDVDGYAGEDWLEDYSKTWTPSEWAGKYVRIEGGDPILIIDNDANQLWFDFPYAPEGNVNYEIGHTDIVEDTVLVAGTDYLIEHKEWDITTSGKGKWKTYVHFLTDQTAVALTVSYFEYGLDGGWPRMIVAGEQVEFGVLYRKNSGFKLMTGAINQVDAVTEMTEGVDYYILPEIIRHKWDYRVQPFGTFLEDQTIVQATISLNSLYAIGGDREIKAIHWGSVDPENAILINASQGDSDYGVNGKKATYTSKLVTKPKVLIYGFTRTIRDGSLNVIPPASREYDQWLFENQIKKMEGIYYDEVWVTGDWDGVVEIGSNLGAYGSIEGILGDGITGLATWQDIADYFDVIIINDTFIEYGAGSPSGCTQWSSWMKGNDYLLIKNFKKRGITYNRDTMLIDRRAGLPAFVWFGGVEPIQNELLNKGSALLGGSTLYYTDLTDVAGCFTYGGISVEDLYDANCSIYTKSENDIYSKYNSTMLTDFRVGRKIAATQHYEFTESDPLTHPRYNIWENGGSWISYIPKTQKGRTFFGTKIISEMSALYLRWMNLLYLTEDEFYKYDELPLYRIPFRREPICIFHSYDYFNATPHPETPWPTPAYFAYYGRNGSYVQCSFLDAPTLLSDVGKYRAGLLLKSTVAAEAYILSKQLFLLESQVDDYKSSFNSTDPQFKGYSGNYISAVDLCLVEWRTDLYITDAGWIADALGGAYGTYFFSEHPEFGSGTVDWGKFIVFDTWNEQLQKVMPLSKTFNPEGGAVPYVRLAPAPLEGQILGITKNIDNTVDIAVNFDITSISVGVPLAAGTITGAIGFKFFGGSIFTFYYVLVANIDMTPYNGYYIYFSYNNTIIIKQILTCSQYGAGAFRITEKNVNLGYLVGSDIEIHEQPNTYKLITIKTDDDRNVIFNGRIISKDNTLRTLKVNLPRGINQSGAGGGIIVYSAVEDQETQQSDGSTKTNISNREILGGRIAGVEDIIGADIGSTFLAEGAVDYNKPMSYLEAITNGTLNDTGLVNKPSSLQHYEWAYGSIGLLEEFGYEKNTGLITCQAFYAHGGVTRPPVLIWPGISEEDVCELIAKMIGIKIVYSDLVVKQYDTIYLYYNSWNDMVKVDSEDVENAVAGHFKFGTLRTSDKTLQKALAKGFTP
jgi:hypothetical protein